MLLLITTEDFKPKINITFRKLDKIKQKKHKNNQIINVLKCIKVSFSKYIHWYEIHINSFYANITKSAFLCLMMFNKKKSSK